MLAILGYSLLFIINMFILHYIENGIAVVIGLVVISSLGIYKLLSGFRHIYLLVAILFQFAFTAYWFSEGIGVIEKVDSNVNFANLPIYSILLFILSIVVGSYFVVMDKKEDKGIDVSETYDNMEQFMASVSGKSKEEIETIGDYVYETRNECEDEYNYESYSQEQYANNKEKGNYFEALIENDYVKRGFQVYKDTPLDSLYKCDLVAWNNQKIEIVQCKFWNADTGYIITGEDVTKVLNSNLKAIEYISSRLGLSDKVVHIRFLVSSYDFIEFDEFIMVFNEFRNKYPFVMFDFKQVNWDEDFNLMVS